MKKEKVEILFLSLVVAFGVYTFTRDIQYSFKREKTYAVVENITSHNRNSSSTRLFDFCEYGIVYTYFDTKNIQRREYGIARCSRVGDILNEGDPIVIYPDPEYKQTTIIGSPRYEILYWIIIVSSFILAGFICKKFCKK